MGNTSAEMAEFAGNLWKNYIQPKIKAEFGSLVSFYRATVVSNSGGTIKVSRPFDDNDGDGFTVNTTSQMSGVTAGENVLVFALGKGNAMNQLIVAYADGAIPSGAAASATNTWYGTSSTAAGTAAKVVACSDYQLAKGNIIAVLFSTANTAAAPTLNVNSTGAKSIYVGSAVANSTTNVCKWSANTLVYFMYDGTYYRLLGRTPGASNSWYGTSSTAAGTTAKTVTCANFRLQAGALISIAFTTANTATAPTLNVNSTGAKAIYLNNAVTSASNLLTWDAGEQMTFIYSGSYYFLVARSSPIKYSSATFTDSLNVTRTVTKQGSRVHMSWGDNYTTTAGSWLTIGTVPEGYRPAAQQRRTLNTYTGLDSWTGQGLVEISTAGVIRIGGSYTGTAVWEIAFDYDV